MGLPKLEKIVFSEVSRDFSYALLHGELVRPNVYFWFFRLLVWGGYPSKFCNRDTLIN